MSDDDSAVDVGYGYYYGIVDRINAGEDKTELSKDYGATDEEIMDVLAYERAA